MKVYLMNYEGKSKKILKEFKSGCKLFKNAPDQGWSVRFYPTHPMGSNWHLRHDATGRATKFYKTAKTLNADMILGMPII